MSDSDHEEQDERPVTGEPRGSRAVTPQWVVMTMLGRFCLDTNPALSTFGYIDVLGRIGLTPHASRLTVSRMTERGYLDRLRRGREAYFRASATGLEIVRRQDEHTFTDTSDSVDADAWTILSFSVPETRRKDRHLLRRRLAWEGFGLLRDGMWIAPGEHDLERILDPALLGDLHAYVDGFTAYPRFGDVERMISRTWHLDQLSEKYHQFLEDWEEPQPLGGVDDGLGRYLLLVTSWRQLIRETPRLPVQHLPADWPAERCRKLFWALHDEFGPQARASFDSILAQHRMPQPT